MKVGITFQRRSCQSLT